MKGFSFAPALFSVFSALRIDKIVPPSRACAGGWLAVNVVLTNGALRIRVHCSKTDTFGWGEWILLHSVSGPVCSIRQFLSTYLCARRGPVFGSHKWFTGVALPVPVSI